MTRGGNGHVGGEPAAPRVVITHDFMEVYGGAERVTEQMALAFPEAPVYSLLVRPSVARRMGIEDRVHAVLPFRERIARHYRLLAPAYPAITRRVELPAADVLLSSSYAYAQHFAAPPGAAHVSYCHSPLRFAWSMTGSYKEEHARGGVAAAGFALLARQQRRADLAASRQVSRYLTQSEFVASQIERFYGREAGVIGAPVDCDLFRPSGEPAQDFFLVCGRLVEPYKRVTVAIEAFAGRPERLVIAGDGPAMGVLRAMAGPNVTFLGALEDDAVVDVMQRCRAAIFPSRDDFGLIPVEVMACGRPVLAFSGGGALATVVDGVTGAFFAEQTARSLSEALDRFEPEAYDPARIREHALNWSADAFRQRLLEEVARAAAAARCEPSGRQRLGRVSDVNRPPAAEDAAGSGPSGGPRVVRDLLTTGSIQAVLLLPSLALSVIGLFVMGVNEYAVWAILFSLGSAAIVLDLGAFPLSQIFRAQGHVSGRELSRLLLQASAIPVALILITTIGWSWFADVFLGGRAAGGPGIALLLGIGTLIRAWQNVANGFALATASERARLRAGIASGVVQLAAVLLVLVMEPLTALGVAYLLGSIVGLAMLAPIAFASLGAAPPRDHPVVAWRTAAAGLAVVLTQLDRLVVGALGASAATLAAYDLAARVVIMAKMGTVLLSTGLVAKSVRASRDHYPVEPAQLRHAAQRLIDRVAVVVFIPLPLLVLIVALAARPSLAGTACAICALLAVGQGFNATTAPTTAVLSGLGRLVPEVTYEAVAVLIMLSLSATIASASPGIGVAFSLSVGLLVGSVWIRRFGGRMLTAEGR